MQTQENNQKQIAGAIIIAGLIIAGAILLKDSNGSTVKPNSKKLLTSAKVFNVCLDSGKYLPAVTDAKNSATTAGVTGTPKAFILVGDQIVNTINGAEPASMIKQKIDDALAGKNKQVKNIQLLPISDTDFVQGDAIANVSVVEYADFQCPFCGRFFKETKTLFTDYIKNNQVKFVYRDFAFLGPESIQAAQAARCAGEQGKFWEYHDYLYTHQNGENQGNFSDDYLKSFAGELKLK
jgi:protein-disulfide isomerase